MSQWFVYMVACGDDTYYTGITTDPERRVREHNSPRSNCRYTRVRQPVTLLVSWEASDRRQALQVEYYIKHRLTREQKEAIISEPVLLTRWLNDPAGGRKASGKASNRSEQKF